MPPKKAPKKAAAKAAVEHARHKAGNDARRTFEHLGRVQVITSLASLGSEALAFLLHAADKDFRARRYKDSAGMLRAAEHLCFASLQRDAVQNVSADLKASIRGECDHLLQRANDHAAAHAGLREVRALMEQTALEARTALKRGSYRAALELARCAEALAHVDATTTPELLSDSRQKRLRD